MPPLISLRNIYWRPVQSPRHEVLKDISLNLNSEDFLLLRGPSGSGKTKLLEIMALHLAPSSGIIVFKNYNIKDMSPSERKKIVSEIAYIGETNVHLETLNLYRNIEYILKLKKTPEKIIFDRIMHILKLTGLITKRELLPGNLSFSEKRLFALSLSLVRETEVILCDFNLSGFDEEEELIRILKNASFRGAGVIVSARKEAKFETFPLKCIDIINGEIK